MACHILLQWQPLMQAVMSFISNQLQPLTVLLPFLPVEKVKTLELQILNAQFIQISVTKKNISSLWYLAVHLV